MTTEQNHEQTRPYLEDNTFNPTADLTINAEQKKNEMTKFTDLIDVEPFYVIKRIGIIR